MSAGNIITAISVVVAAGGLTIAFATYRRLINSRDEWLKEDDTFIRGRTKLKHDMADLQEIARNLQKKWILDENVPLLVRPGWITPVPLTLDELTLEWEEPRVSEEQLRAALEPTRQVTRMYWARRKELGDTYHEVISRVETPDSKLFFDGSSYRLLDVAVRDDVVSNIKAHAALTFTAGRYFDALDTTDVLGYETALLTLRSPVRSRSPNPMQGPYRKWLGDPFDLRRRCAIPGVCTLTIRRGTPVPSFILHERNPQKVALAQGVVHVTPAGEFQPRNLSNLASITDLDLWNNMTREYAEEWLGVEQAQGQPIDERNSTLLWDTMTALNNARDAGRAKVNYLGIGLDPLTWKPEILMVTVFDADVFDSIFASIVRENDEGKLVFKNDRTTAGIPFTEDNVDHRIRRGRMLTAGKACLYLAWRHRHILGIRD